MTSEISEKYTDLIQEFSSIRGFLHKKLGNPAFTETECTIAAVGLMLVRHTEESIDSAGEGIAASFEMSS